MATSTITSKDKISDMVTTLDTDKILAVLQAHAVGMEVDILAIEAATVVINEDNAAEDIEVFDAHKQGNGSPRLSG